MKVITDPHQLISFRSQRESSRSPLEVRATCVGSGLAWKPAGPALGQGESGVSSRQAGCRHEVGQQMAWVLGQSRGQPEQKLGGRSSGLRMVWGLCLGERN